MIGTSIGQYEVVARLGAGGMGEVYRARDTKLGRDVALKILPALVAHDPDHLARFRREAYTLASLNHSGIAHLYGLDDSTSQVVLVMELVEGPTLADRIARGPIPIDEALPMAVQICEAVEAAHDRGIVHRDLKPANIKVRPDGAIKVLDFGLAKAHTPSGESEASTLAMTSPGSILGTAAYMAPEQAKGLSTGVQADIWAFGCVLFEMLSGRNAFARATFAETIANVIGGTPDFDALPAATPPGVRRVIRRCLEKDVRARLHHLGDARADLTDAIARPESPPGSPSLSGRRAPRTLALVGIAALTAVAAGAGWWWAQREDSRVPVTPVRLFMPFVGSPRNQPFGTRHIAISADGTTVAYAAVNTVWVRRMHERDARAVGTAGWNPFLSPDGQWVLFFTGNGLFKVPVEGGSPTVVAETTERPGGGVWVPDDTIVFATNGGLYRVAAAGGRPELLLAPDRAKGERLFTSPEMLPGGRSVLFTVAAGDTNTRLTVVALDLQTRAVTRVLEDASSARYVSTGHLIYAAGSVMKAVAFDAGTLKPTERPFDLPDVDASIAKDNGVADYAIAPSGTLVFVPTYVQQVPRSLSWFDRSGKEESIAMEARPFMYARVSPDARKVALDVRGNNRDIWILDLASLSQVRLTDGPTEDMLPVWSRDGRRVFFASDRQGNFDIYSQPADGATGARLEFAAPGFQAPDSLTPDDTGLVVVEEFKETSFIHLTGSRRLEKLVSGNFEAVLGQLSPDGRWLAYESTEGGSGWEVYVRPFPQVLERREKISIAGGRFPVWSPKSNELFYVEMDGDVMSASLTLSPALHVDRVTTLFRWRALGTGVQGRQYDVSPADGRFLMPGPLVEAGGAGPTHVSVVLNWHQELRKREQAARLE